MSVSSYILNGHIPQNVYVSLPAQYLEPKQTAYLILEDLVRTGQGLHLSKITNPLIHINRFPRNTILDLTLRHCNLTSEQLRQILTHQQGIQ